MGKLYNLDRVNELADGDEEFVQSIIETFLEEVSFDLQEMSEAVEKQNAKLAYQFAHKMKPSFIMFAIPLVEKVKLLEGWRDGKINYEQAKPIFEEITTTANMVFAQLKEAHNI